MYAIGDHYQLGDQESLNGGTAFKLGLERWKLFHIDKMMSEK